jgi:hypothetical protein
VKKTIAVHLKRNLALLELARSKADVAHMKWRSMELGFWKEAGPRWRIYGEKIRFRFKSQGNNVSRWIVSIRPKPWGMALFLSRPNGPMHEVLEIAWEEAMPEASADSSALWDTARYWLGSKFPGHQIIKACKRADLRHTLSGLFLRVLFCHRGKAYLLLAADEDGGDEVHLAVGQALQWLSTLAAKNRTKPISKVCILVPSMFSGILVHRCQYLNRNRIRAEVWAYTRKCLNLPEIRRALHPPVPEENKDFHWPVLGPFRWSPRLEQVLNLAPSLIRRYPRFQDYDSLRLWGLEFARVMGPERNRICFGVGELRTELSDSNFESLQSLVREILLYRRPDSPDVQHPYYRLQAERWLEALILEDVPRLFPEMAPQSVYSQIPVYLGKDPGRIDVLGADRHGTLIVMELKVTADPDLPLQALDYWGRVIRHNQNGDFERRGYFSEIRLNRQNPKIYLISPIFSFHNSTESLLRYLDRNLEICKISINDDWRFGVRIMRRMLYRCMDLE